MKLHWPIIVVISLVILTMLGYRWITRSSEGFTRRGIELASTNDESSSIQPYDVSMSSPIVAYDYSDGLNTEYQSSGGNIMQQSLYDESAPTISHEDSALDTEYHDSVEVIQQYAPITTMVLINGVLTPLPWTDTSSNVEYNPPGYYKYGSKTYVPTYTDSVYLTYGSPMTPPLCANSCIGSYTCIKVNIMLEGRGHRGTVGSLCISR